MNYHVPDGILRFNSVLDSSFEVSYYNGTIRL